MARGRGKVIKKKEGRGESRVKGEYGEEGNDEGEE
jgi:hypothetical protein